MRVAVVDLSLAFVACRSVWVHPQATAEKYADDSFFCKYGIERSEWVPPEPPSGEGVTRSERVWALGEPDYSSLGPPRDDWKRCMIRLGWHTVAGPREDKDWRVQSSPMPRRR